MKKILEDILMNISRLLAERFCSQINMILESHTAEFGTSGDWGVPVDVGYIDDFMI